MSAHDADAQGGCAGRMHGADARRGEGVEYPLITVVVAGGAAAGVTLLKEATQAKTALLTASVTTVDNS